MPVEADHRRSGDLEIYPVKDPGGSMVASTNLPLRRLENIPCQVRPSTIYHAIDLGHLEVEKVSHRERNIARKLRHQGKIRHRQDLDNSMKESPDKIAG